LTNSDNNKKIAELIQATHEYIPGVGVFDLDLEVHTSSIFGLIGPSGCGKTTIVRLLLGLLKPNHGVARVLNTESTKLSGRLREKLGYLPQHFVLYPNLSVVENLRFVSSLYGYSITKRNKQIDEIIDLVELSEAKKRLAKDLSGGMKRRLELAAALLHDPELVFADEPTTGIDPILRNKLWSYFRDFRDMGKTLFITTQYVGEANFCDVVGVMSTGRLLHVDSPANLYRQALGGEVVVISVEPSDIDETMEILNKDRRIHKIDKVKGEPGSLHLTVDNSGEMIPYLAELFSRKPDILLQKINRYEPPFDEIFPLLVRKKKEGEKPGP
jgi:ABC-2 type transport system ATP-binding protein